MNSRYEILTSVIFEHEYFSGHKFTGLSVNVSEDTRRCLLRLGLLFKARPDGFMLLMDTAYEKEKQKKELLESGTYLQFACTIKDPHFYNYTSLPKADISTTYFYFYNDPARSPIQNNKYLAHVGEFVSEEDIVPAVKMNYVFSIKPFALLDLNLNDQLQESYYIRFATLSLHWHYVLVSDHLKNLDRPAVIDTASRETFNGPQQVTLPDNRTAISFISKDPLQLSQSAGKRFQLMEQYDATTGKGKVVLSALPLPDISIISSIAGSGGTSPPVNTSEILIY